MTHGAKKTYYFLGIGGIGMSALARFFKRQGNDVSGYDKTPTKLTRELVAEGIDVHYQEDIAAIPAQVDLVVYTPAVPKEHAEYRYFVENNFPMKKRAEVLGEVVKNNFLIAVAGTHGKTTITGMIAHIFQSAGIPVNAFIGGIVKNFQSNILYTENAVVAVTEADEYDRSFLSLNPDIAIISAIDADHLDIYSDKKNLVDSYHAFAGNINPAGSLIIKKGLPGPAEHVYSMYHYDKSAVSDFYAKDVFIKNAGYNATICLQGEEIQLAINIPGRHNIENAVAAAAACYLFGIDASEIKCGIEAYEGVVRRFDVRYQQGNTIYIDDYAHHPEELRAFISTIRELYPDKKITGIFQPHLYSRTRDFAPEFAEVLDQLDEAILLDIYPARELPLEGITSHTILDRMKIADKKILSKELLLDELRHKETQVVLTMGAGDIDQLIEPIIAVLKEKK
ncbi:MAG TPA: UDP-N-acetylmuramate--L-alanine ligase [Bacteroidales bacterium]|nr:UDP-N-acetylmuramate--L-alanine ligase [Bacteroidales bacterium]